MALGAGLVMSVGCPALANPQGPTVRHGQVNISPGTHAQIQQLTDRAIVDWESFSVGRAESLVFIQPSQLSVILNRVTGGDPSAILGQLSANGNVFLINSNGILFGPDSVVNVGGLVASTLNLNDDDFLSGNYRFFADSSGDLGAVINQGRITISDGGYAVLTGPAVLNEGLIVAKAGKVVLASGERATLNLDGRDLVHFSLDSSIGEGDVLLAPGALTETLADALGVNPALRADRLVQEADGSVRMVRSSGTLVQAGTVSVDGGDGVDAGSILLDSTDVTILSDGSVTSASGVGVDSGGGDVLVLSDMDGDRSLGFTDVHTGALISATGGSGGDAGFVEVSGNRLNLHGEVDLSAPNGEAGTFLLDPQTYTIIDGDNMPTTVGDFVTVGDQYFNTLTGTTLVISSTGDVIFDLGIDGTNPTNDGVMSFLNLSGNRVNLTINSGTDPDPDGIIDFGDDGITVSGLNSLTLNSEGGVLFGDSRVVVDGNVNVDSVGAIQLQTGTLLVTNDGDITLDGEDGVDLGSGFINPGAGGGSTGFLHILSDGDIDLGTSTITVNANNEINPLSITAGDPLDLLAPPADLILGGAQISVVDTGGASGVQGLILTATGDIDFGSSDMTYSHNRSGSGTYEDRITAGGNIFSSAAPDGDPGNFLNNYIITGDTGPLLMTAGGSIVLTDLFLDVNEVDGNVFRDTTIAANGGVLNLGSSTIDIVTALTLSSSSDIIFDSPRLTTQNGGDLDIQAGGTVNFTSGTLNSRGYLHISGDGDVSLGSSTLTVNSPGEINPLAITAGDPLDMLAAPADLLLGDAQMTVTAVGGASGIQGLLLSATGDIDLGASDLTYSQDRSTAGSYQDRITAGGDIFSSAVPDGDPGNFLNNYIVTGDTGSFTMTAGGSIVLTDLFLDVNEVDGNVFRDTTIAANGGVLNLGSSTIDIVTALTLSSSSDIIFDSPRLTTQNGGDLDIQAGGTVNFTSGTLNSRGYLHISGDGDVSLGSSTLTVNSPGEINPLAITAGDPLDMLAAPADLLLGDAQMTVTAVGGASGIQGLLLSATGDIDLGASDLTYSQDRSTSGSYQDRITAGGDIFSSAAPDGDPGTFLNNYIVTGDSGPFEMRAGGSIVLTDLFLDVNEFDNGVRDATLAADGGVLNLGSSDINSENGLALTSTSDIILVAPTLTTQNGGNLDIDADGSVSVVGGTFLSRGHLHIAGDEGVSLGDSVLSVNSVGPINPLSITAGDAMLAPADLLLGDAQISVMTNGGASGVQGLILTATGDIDLGSSDLTYSHDRGGGGIYQDRINAGGSIFSSVAPDGNPNTFVNNYSVTGDSGEFTMTAGTDILLPDMRLVVDEFEGQTQNVVLTAEAGQMFLGESEIVALDGDVRLQASGLLDLDSSRLTTVDQLVLSSNTAVSANGSGFTAPDIEVFGFDPMTMVPGGAVNGDVELDLAITTLVDLTVLATGNVDITNTGGGTIRADAIGGVGLSSTNGDVSVVTDGNLASGSGTDVFAANTVNLVAANIGIGSPFQVEGSKVALDTSSDAGSVMNVEVLGTTTSFLSVAGNDSVIDVREVNTGGLLDVNANILDLPLLGIEEILISNVNGLTLDSLVIGPDQSVGIKALGGDITATSNNSVNLSGALALEASGDVGENLLPITVAGGTLAIDSGGQVFVEGTGPALTIGTVLFDQDPSVPQKSVAGISATDDIVVVLTGSGPTQLVQEADIATTGGNVALVAVEGGLVQTSGVVRGGDVVLKADGNVGEYDGTNVLSECGVEAERLILDIGGDAIVDQQTGDLTIAQQATVGGNLFTATGAGGDLRVRNSGGDLTLEADLDSGGEAALLTGDNLTVTQGGLANSVFLNGSLTAADSLVVISAGDISQTSGVLTAPKIGLGAVGQIGSPSQPINVVTDETALNPLNAQVSDPDGFTPVASVSAAGATVNQQTLPPPPPDPVVPPEPVIPPVIPPSAFEPPADFLPNEDFVAEAFSANNTEMVEEVFAILEMLDEPLVEEDPSRVPILWPEDEDFMQKKFRR